MKSNRRYHPVGRLCLLLWDFSQFFQKYVSVNFLQGSWNDTDDDDDDGDDDDDDNDDDDDDPGNIFKMLSEWKHSWFVLNNH